MATDAAPKLREDSEPGRETDDRDTEPHDYAALNAVYAVLLAGVLYAARERAGRLGGQRLAADGLQLDAGTCERRGLGEQQAIAAAGALRL